ncbi:MAG: STAS/SEC14 domain-containing protein [Gillisia sp.]
MVPTFELADHVVGFIIDENADKETYDTVHQKIRAKIEDYGKVNLYCEVKKGFHLPFKSFLSELAFKLENSQNIDKMACVTEVSLFRSIMEMNNLLSHTHFKTYKSEERLEAINWISE